MCACLRKQYNALYIDTGRARAFTHPHTCVYTHIYTRLHTRSCRRRINALALSAAKACDWCSFLISVEIDTFGGDLISPIQLICFFKPNFIRLEFECATRSLIAYHSIHLRNCRIKTNSGSSFRRWVTAER